ncbi:type 1 glutamine amidotransferase domain-containing protein [Bifidobacterium psychraerophilum]|jgi:protease I|uniref:Putative intracellular protease/amidase n=1 Tax=Bifidobacterium psychraerophilum TaxID=218140 RepID=A0A087CFE8_9BIFI|nr:type 1 glutamine amidotransferase domain-containing protein [Bifidobacterium psychraerophilum]KFI81998.1 putative intracellular protease/amidase [Bifidobacterium psychraerophilum]MCI1659623.1 type 1 glutamine amidotransferase [Bifidobacterium psychraerophilum]MCI1803859.1 type 1 glutamine amidotransferase [Bifidobacterium psychraerophilum]MCI2176133.1 type 1 glutamine amidotransferase [Bifidobacterium psychraerophilum]MCI2181394.1 type 1 glutamine amidotransferase [Bifidobacterium psychraer
MSDIRSRKILIAVHDWGIEETELTRPLGDLREAGAQVTLASPTSEDVQTVQHDRYPGVTVTPDALLSDVKASDYDLLVVPGGTCNVDHLRINPSAIELAKDFAKEGKPIAAICHGPWLLVNAGVLGGKTLTSCRYIKADVENAGGVHEDREVVVDDASGWKLITSRKPDDLDAFVNAIEDAL